MANGLVQRLCLQNDRHAIFAKSVLKLVVSSPIGADCDCGYTGVGIGGKLNASYLRQLGIAQLGARVSACPRLSHGNRDRLGNRLPQVCRRGLIIVYGGFAAVPHILLTLPLTVTLAWTTARRELLMLVRNATHLLDTVQLSRTLLIEDAGKDYEQRLAVDAL